MRLSPRVAMSRSQKLIKPFVPETTEFSPAFVFVLCGLHMYTCSSLDSALGIFDDWGYVNVCVVCLGVSIVVCVVCLGEGQLLYVWFVWGCRLLYVWFVWGCRLLYVWFVWGCWLLYVWFVWGCRLLYVWFVWGCRLLYVWFVWGRVNCGLFGGVDCSMCVITGKYWGIRM